MNTTRRLVFDVFDPFRDELDAMIDRAAEEAMAEIARMIRRAHRSATTADSASRPDE